MHIGDFKAQFSDVIKLVEKGVTIKVIKGRAGEVIGYFSKKKEVNLTKPRPVGLLQNEHFVLEKDFFQMSAEELDEWGV